MAEEPVREEQQVQEEQEAVVFCKWHPQVETGLRCYQCGAPICPRCAQRTPVGYLCPDCRKGRKQNFEHSLPADYVIAGVVSLILGGIAGTFLPLVGWFVIFLSPLSGTLIAEVVWYLVDRRYGSHLWQIISGCIIVGSLPMMLMSLLSGDLFVILWSVVHVVMAIGTVMARLRLQ
ncbi:MAG: hypothetical protein RBT47_04085 [Anaerolineae bacterium]|jgi:hypothetical protein|nr:hypothetical protein [Anaerolineae bacterium]